MKESNNIDANIKELDRIVPPKRTLKTLSGDKIELPVITLGLELRVMRIFFEFLKCSGNQDSDLTSQSLQNILINAFCNDKGNELILDIFAIISGKPVEWLLDNVDITSMVECILPFFVARAQALTNAMGSLAGAGKATPN